MESFATRVEVEYHPVPLTGGGANVGNSLPTLF